MLKKITPFIIILLFGAPEAQTNPTIETNYKKIDEYIVGKHTHDNTTECITILYSSTDCEKCIFFLQSTLPEIEKHNPNLRINVITDNIAYARKNLKKYKLQYNYYFDKDIFSMFDINGRTKLYLRKKEIFVDDISTIQNYIKPIKDNNIELVAKFTDSIVMPNDIETRIMPLNSFLTLNPKMDIAVLFQRDTNQKKKEDYRISYLNKSLKDSLMIYRLQERNPDPKNLNLISFNEFSKVAKANNINFYKIHTITSYGNVVYCTFSISRLYKNISEDNSLSLFSNSFIPQKEIRKNEDLQHVMEIDTYDNIYFADLFNYENSVYPMSTWIYATPDYIGKNTFTTNINRLVPETGNLEFAGKATVLLDPKTKTGKITGIDSHADNVRRRINSFEKDNFLYKVKKEMTDEAKNIGFIIITKEELKKVTSPN